jgi:hypothetical protein
LRQNYKPGDKEMPKIVLMIEKDENGKIADYILPEPRNRRLFEPERINIHKPQTIPNLEEAAEQNSMSDCTA